MNVLIIGLGISGRSAAAFLLGRGIRVTAIDRRADLLRSDPELCPLLEKGMHLLSDHSLSEVESFNQVILSPGISLSHPVARHALEKKIEIIGEIELACRALKRPLIAVTGTNGKTTVTQLIGHVLNRCGIAAKVLGNGGEPLAIEVDRLTDEVVVCELSSYQLETLNSRVIDTGVILNITPDHLDRYCSMEAYARAKLHMQRCLKPGRKLFVSPQVMTDFGHMIKENVELFFNENYKGCLTHDKENEMAAKSLCLAMGVGSEEFERAAGDFRPLPHRIEFVRKKNGISYFNDSKGTNLDAVKRAVERMEGPVILIAGGKGKGVSFCPWIVPFKGKVKMILAIGETRNRLEKELGGDFRVVAHGDLASAVSAASSVADDGDNVLLSPGCASFDMFNNFEERGNHFKECVHSL